MPDAFSLAIALAGVAGLGGLGLQIASAFVRRSHVRGGVYCFGFGLLIMQGGNFARTWMASLQRKAELQALVAQLSPADRAAPEMKAEMAWAAERLASPPVGWLDWTMLTFAILFAAVALLRPEWLMLPQDRIKLGLDPFVGPHIRLAGPK